MTKKSSNSNLNSSNNQKNANNSENINILLKDVLNPVWLSITESAKLGGVTPKTIRRAIQSKKIAYKIIKNRYIVDFSSVIKYLSSNKKLLNKLIQNGIGQYIDKWHS